MNAADGLGLLQQPDLQQLCVTPHEFVMPGEGRNARTGVLLIPGQLMAAASPFAYAWLNKTLGIAGAMWVSTGLTLVIAGLAIAIARRPRRQTVSHCIQSATLTNGYKTPPPANISDT